MKHMEMVTNLEKPRKSNSHCKLHRIYKASLTQDANTIHPYKWTIKTVLGTYTGTCLSIKDLNQKITMLTSTNMNNKRIVQQ